MNLLIDAFGRDIMGLRDLVKPDTLLTLVKIVAHAFLVMGVGLLFMGMGRRFTAKFQRRLGPPLWQSFIDVVKCFSRKSISHHYIMDLGSLMGLAGLLAAAAFMPVGRYQPFPSTGPIFVILYLMPIGYLGMAMGVSASGNPLASIGIGRALTLMLGYEVPFAMIVLCMVALFNSTSLVRIASLQQAGLLSWNVFTMPFGFVAGVIALQAMLAEKPFDTMIAPSEVASGPMVELSGKFLGLAFLQHSAAIFVETGLIVLLFLGGGPGMPLFLFKMFLVYMLSIAINAVWARYRVEQAMKFLWWAAGGLAFVQLVINMYLR
jgi:NADH-quinone oxidoreductase subunit H